MFAVLTNALSWVITSVGSVLTAITDEAGDLVSLLPLVGIAFGLAMIGFVFSLIKRLTWGA